MQSKKILVIEDDSDLMMATSELLKELTVPDVQIAVESASDGEAALELLKNNHYDLLITDLRLPRLNGDQVIQRLRANKGLNSKIPVILTSGHFKDFEGGKASISENDKSTVLFLEKPFHLANLEEAVSIHLADIEL